MRSNHTLEVLRAGGTALGIWMPSSQPLTARMLAYQGCLDWLMFDGEHAPIDVSTLALCCAMTADISRGGCTPLTRVAAGTVDQIKRALDAGAQGVLVPLVNTAEQAAEVVQHAKYPPQGARGNGGLVCSLYSEDQEFLRKSVEAVAPYHGRIFLGHPKIELSPGPGTVLPQLVHGGPGRAGGGEELGGARGLAFYMQRVALEGARPVIQKLLG